MFAESLGIATKSGQFRMMLKSLESLEHREDQATAKPGGISPDAIQVSVMGTMSG